MVGGIYGGSAAAGMSGIKNYQSKKPASVNNYDYKAAQAETKKLIDQYKKNNNTVQQLKTDSAKFLDEFIGSMDKLGKSAQTVKGSNFDQLLGAMGEDGKPTKENIDKTVDAIVKLAEQFNSSLKTVAANVDRGSGTARQLEGMKQSPTSQRAMEFIGINTKKDGSLEVDVDKLKAALKEKPEIVRDVVAGSSGMAQGIARDSTNGLNKAPAALIGNDLAAMKKQQEQSAGSFESMSLYSKSGAYNMMNLNSVGVLMNMMI